MFLLLKGKVLYELSAACPSWIGCSAAGSLLGLPSTFTGRPYSLYGASSHRMRKWCTWRMKPFFS